MSAYTEEHFEEIKGGGDGYGSDPEIETKTKTNVVGSYSSKGALREGLGVRGHLPQDNTRFQYVDAFTRHQEYIRMYVSAYINPNREAEIAKAQAATVTDRSILEKEHRFVWDPKVQDSELDWNQRLAKRYYDKLFKEYALCDLSRYKTGEVALRWRTQKEVFSGKGQFVCGSKACDTSRGLQSWEVNFKYLEANEKKNVLVKVRLCSKCSSKLNYKSLKRKAKIRKRMDSAPNKRRRVEEIHHSELHVNHHTPKEEGSNRLNDQNEDRCSEKYSDSDSDVRRLRKRTMTGNCGDSSVTRVGSRSPVESEEEEVSQPLSSVWEGKREKDETELREEEMDQYLEDLFV
eukprot:CFRG7099T1